MNPPPDSGLVARLAETDDSMTALRREMRRLLVVVTLAIVIFAAAIGVTLLLVDSQVNQLRAIGTVNCAEVEGLKVAIRDVLRQSDSEQMDEFLLLFEAQPCPRR
jgi:cbb3-type cytochrome oxidase cytochrome c subunit